MKLTAELVSVIDKVVSAPEEARIWLIKLKRIGDTNKSIAKFLELRRRTNRLCQPEDLASYLEGGIEESIEACKEWLEKVYAKVGPVAKGYRQNLAGPLWDYKNVNYMKKQKLFLDLHEREISMALHLLAGVDLAAISQGMHRMNDYLTIVDECRCRVRAEVAEAEASTSPTEDDIETSQPTGGPSSVNIDPDQLELPETREQYAALLRPAIRVLMEGVRSQNAQWVEFLLLEMSEDAQSKFYVDAEQWNCLHYAALGRSPQIMKLLLENGLQDQTDYLDMKTLQGETPLMVAAKHASAEGTETLDMIKLLVQAGSNVNVLNQAEQSALYFAIDRPPSSESEKIAELLIEKGADIAPVKNRMPEQVRKYRLESVSERPGSIALPETTVH